MSIKNEIEDLRKELHQKIVEYGINSKEVAKISTELDILINKYNKANLINLEYEKAIKAIKKITKEFGGFPTVEEWNKYAKENLLLSSESIKNISKMNWNQLRDKINQKKF